MDQETNQLVKTLLRLHVGLVAHVQAQDSLLEYLAGQIVAQSGRVFDLGAHRTELVRLSEDAMKLLPASEEQLEAFLAEALKRLPLGEPPQKLLGVAESLSPGAGRAPDGVA